MKIFITGGTGLTGNSIIQKLSGSGHHINAIYRQTSPEIPGVNWIQSDLSDFSAEMKSALMESDIIIHNGASLRAGNSIEEINEIDLVNIEATRNILDLVSENGIRKFIFTSSLSILKKPLPDPVVEESEINPLFPYAVSKFKGEQLVIDYAGKYNFKYNILRLSSPVGTDLNKMHNNVLKLWILKSMEGDLIQVYGDGKRTQDFVSVHDIATAFLNCTTKVDVSGIFNIASGTSLPMHQLASLITKHFGNKFEFYGTDSNSADRWNISIKKAGEMLDYHPQYTSATAVQLLLDSITR